MQSQALTLAARSHTLLINVQEQSHHQRNINQAVAQAFMKITTAN